MTALPGHQAQVQSDWIDHNGHMNVAYYVKVFDDALEACLDHLGLGVEYRRDQNKSLFVVEAHIVYQREADRAERLVVNTQLIGFDAKRIRLFHQMHNLDKAVDAASQDVLLVHVDQAQRSAAPMDGAFEQVFRQHLAAGDPPASPGRQIKSLANCF